MRPGLSLTSFRLTFTTATAGASRVAYGPRCIHAAAITPAGQVGLIRSYSLTSVGLPHVYVGSAPAMLFSRPAQRLLTLRPAYSPSLQGDLLHRRLQRLHFFRRCPDCYRVERSSSRVGLPPTVVQRLFTAHAKSCQSTPRDNESQVANPFYRSGFTWTDRSVALVFGSYT
jgi:hypothetical protein